MNRTLKIFISVLSAVFISVIFNCLYGFLIGGQKNVTYYCLCIAVSVLLSLGFTAGINGKEYLKEKNYSVLIVVAVGLLVLFSALYNPLNSLSKSNDFAEYQSEITYVGAGGNKSFVLDDVTFLDRNGKEITKRQVTEPISFDDEPVFEEGKGITVREYMGGFGFSVYELLPCNSENAE